MNHTLDSFTIPADINRQTQTKVLERLTGTLIRQGIITEEILQNATAIQSLEPGTNQRKLIDILIHDLNVEAQAIYVEMARLYGFETIDWPNGIEKEHKEFIKEIINSLPDETSNQLLKNKILPFKWHNQRKDVIVVVTSDPTDQTVHQVAKSPHFEIAYAPLDRIESLIQEIFYANNEFLSKVFEGANEVEILDDDTKQIDEKALDTEINRSRLTNLVEGMFVEAVRKGASDIHVIPKENNVTEICFRFDGKLQSWYRQTEIRPEAIIAVIKDRALNIDRFVRSQAQDGYIQRKIDGFYIRFRVSVIPIVGTEFDRRFESIVLRVLDDRKIITDLATLGMQKQAQRDFTKAIEQPHGMVILTGPTGSGKSTTLVAALSHVMDPSRNILTVEEPVEYLIPGARQIKLSANLDFDSALRSILRHDPDTIMLGEIRDLKSAEIAISLANTGHLTFSTLHTNDAPSAISRLCMLGVEPFLIANAINLVMAQRLVRKLCTQCKKLENQPDADLMFHLGFSKEEIENTKFYKPVGCKDCFEGYKGRIAISETILFTREIRKEIIKSKGEIDEDSIRHMGEKNDMLSLRDSGRKRIKAGITTLQEIIETTVEQ